MTQIDSALSRASVVVELEPGRYQANLDADWSVAGMLNGGYLNLPVARAAILASPHPDVMAVTTDYLLAPAPGTAELAVQTLKAGRTVAYHRVTMSQGDKVVVSASVVTGRLADGSGQTILRAEPVPLPPVELCDRVPAVLPGGFVFGLMEHLDVRMTPESTAAMDKADESLRVAGWLRAADGTPPDPFLALLAVDALPPVTRTTTALGWAPTVQLSTYLRATPAPGWLSVYVRGSLVGDGWFDEDAYVYDEAGRLVAQSRQLARLPRG
ncbi:thioesterase family protein [Fodinicola acaciae]|uniref:thioesterase family protein n=1 Tax=Fodinicola acaciae TaxID=2681555 RepID=UPI0013D2CEC4|nr:thioesterase family protein [Fodinicola acaciae]